MKKALITFLGTGGGKRSKGIATQEYRLTKYVLPNQTITEKSPFVGLVLAKEMQCSKLKIFGTVYSMWPTILVYLNDKYSSGSNEFDEIIERVWDLHEKPELADMKDDIGSCITALTKKETEIIFHDNVGDKNSMWNFFDQLAYSMSDSENIILDITHGFRHLPLFSLTSLSFITTINPRVKIHGLYYASFESKKNTNDEDEPTEIVDLSPAWDMIQWYHSARDFIIHGNGIDLVNRIELIEPNLAKALKGVNDTLRLTFIETLDNRFNNLAKNVDQNTVHQFPQLKYLSKCLTDFSKIFPKDQIEWKNQINIAKWYYEHTMFQQALTAFVEGVKTYAMIECGLDWKDRIVRDEFPKEKFKGDKNKNKILGEELTKLYNKANRWRNEVNHGGLLFKNAASMTKSVLDEINRVFTSPVLKELLNRN